MSSPAAPRIEPLRREQLSAAAWCFTVQVRFQHCDPAGIIFTPRYFDMLHEAVETFFIDRLGIDYYHLLTERKTGLGYAHASCEFLKPNRMGDTLDVFVLIERIGRSSYTLILPVVKGGVEVARGRLVTVVTSLETFAACAIPEDVRAGLLEYRDAVGEVALA